MPFQMFPSNLCQRPTFKWCWHFCVITERAGSSVPTRSLERLPARGFPYEKKTNKHPTWLVEYTKVIDWCSNLTEAFGWAAHKQRHWQQLINKHIPAWAHAHALLVMKQPPKSNKMSHSLFIAAAIHLSCVWALDGGYVSWYRQAVT